MKTQIQANTSKPPLEVSLLNKMSLVKNYPREAKPGLVGQYGRY